MAHGHSGPSSEPVHLDTSPPSEMVVKEISILKKYKAAGLDRLSTSFFKDGSKALTSELTKILGAIWERKEIPKDWREPVIVPTYKKNGSYSEKLVK